MTTKNKNIDPEQVAQLTTSEGKNAAAVALGRKGGVVTSERKSKAARLNSIKAVAAHKRNARARRKAAEQAEREARAS